MIQGKRHSARRYALQVLYALDVNDTVVPVGALNTYVDVFALEAEEESLEFARLLVEQFVENADEIDEAITQAATHWRLDRMARIDRNILRLATAELRLASNVPQSVVINEAVELAKEFGSEDARRFVNGVVDKIASQFR